MSKSPDAFRTISEVAEDLDLPQHVLRFWETRFGQIRPMKRGGGRRYYRPDDVELLRGIRHLLYGEGYTIRGVQRILKEQGPRFVVGAGRGGTVELPGESDRVEPHAYMNGESELVAEAAEAPPMEIDREDHDPDDDLPESHGVVGVARRLVGHFRESRGEAPVPAAGLPAEDARRLHATVAELLECKRILDSAR